MPKGKSKLEMSPEEEAAWMLALGVIYLLEHHPEKVKEALEKTRADIEKTGKIVDIALKAMQGK